MTSPWPSFTRQKLFLATTLFQLADKQDQASARESALQGGIALLGESRQALLGLIADIYQVRNQFPTGIDALADCLGGDRSELEELRTLAIRPGSWWQHMEQLFSEQNQPAERKRAPAPQENVIAVSAQSGPERTIPALLETTNDMKQYLEMILERHDEW